MVRYYAWIVVFSRAFLKIMLVLSFFSHAFLVIMLGLSFLGARANALAFFFVPRGGTSWGPIWVHFFIPVRRAKIYSRGQKF